MILRLRVSRLPASAGSHGLIPAVAPVVVVPAATAAVIVAAARRRRRMRPMASKRARRRRCGRCRRGSLRPDWDSRQQPRHRWSLQQLAALGVGASAAHASIGIGSAGKGAPGVSP
jgi:hypothetical protein